MTAAYDLWRNLHGYLRVTARVVGKEGGNINVGEAFTLRVTGSNAAYSGNRDKPTIVFLNPTIFIKGTQYAHLANGGSGQPLPDRELFPGESSWVDIEMKAISEISNDFIDSLIEEDIANVAIRATLDQARFFRVWNSITAREEIVET
ncbi:hypothetical protein [Nonomuraea sp. NPDC049141]|uniref:hypothetical protein n=1 Tax=Nonomuraea sp. NPDC049141 TaxID=3155500 RepID=UPI0033D4B11E